MNTEDTNKNPRRILEDRFFVIMLVIVALLTAAFGAAAMKLIPNSDILWAVWNSFLLANLVFWVAVLGIATVNTVRRGLRDRAVDQSETV